MEKYKDSDESKITGRILPGISNQKLNSYLKEIADLCKIDKNITFHTARHTFATTVTLSNGVPIETVSKMLGHSKISTTQIYARVVETKISNDMNELKATLSGNKVIPFSLRIAGDDQIEELGSRSEDPDLPYAFELRKRKARRVEAPILKLGTKTNNTSDHA